MFALSSHTEVGTSERKNRTEKVAKSLEVEYAAVGWLARAKIKACTKPWSLRC